MAGITEDEAVARINQYMKTAAETEIDGLRQLLQSVREQCMAEAHAQDVPFDTQYDDTLSIRVRRTMAGDLIGAIKGAEDVRAAARERLEAMQGEYIHDLSGREAQAMQNRTLREIYDYMGYETVWVTTTGECDLCQRLNGMVVGAGSRFTVDTQTSRLYPPIHKGCTCQIAARENAETVLTDQTPDDTMPLPKKVYKIEPEEIPCTLNVAFKDVNGIVPNGATVDKVVVIAGAGTSEPIRDLNRLVSQNPEADADSWQKKVGTVEGKSFTYQVHWYQSNLNAPLEEYKVKEAKRK